MTKPALHIVPPDPSPRQQLITHQQTLTEANAAMSAAQARIDAAVSAGVDVEAAEEALRAHLFEDAIAGTADHATRKTLRDAVVSARERRAGIAALHAEHDLLNVEAKAHAEAVKAAVRAVVEAEATELAALYHHHERLAVFYRRAVERLRDDIFGQGMAQEDRRSPDELAGRPRDHGDRDVLLQLAARLGQALDYGPDPETAVAGRNAILADAERYADAWARFPQSVAADPTHTVPAPEAR